MALLFMDGFDAGDCRQKGYIISNPNWISSSASTRFNEGYSMYMVPSSISMRRDITPSSQVFVGFAIKIEYNGSIGLCTDAGATIQLTLNFSTTGMTLQRGGTVLGSYNYPFANWGGYVELGGTIDPTSGSATVRLNGINVITFSGNTKNGGTSNTIDQLYYFGNGTYFDDFYVCNSTGSAPHNSFLGDVRIKTLAPDGAGSSTQFTPSSGANYTTVDELPYSATDYVSSSTVGNRDTYSVADLSGTPTIYGVQNNVIAKKTDAGTVSLKPAIKSGTTVYYGSTQALGTTDSVISDIRPLDPNTSSSWSQASVNALESGFEVA